MEQGYTGSKIQNSITNSSKKPAFIPFIVSGFPNFEVTKDLLKFFEQKGAAAVELGFPYSDPLADGPVIQKASKFSLEQGTNINKIFGMLDEVKDTISVPIILFTYFNPVMKYGIENFVKKAASVNASGIIIPDLPLEESEEVISICKKYGIDFIMLVSPTSGEQRIKDIAQKSSGFIYLVSSTGVTGVREGFSNVLGGIFEQIKSVAQTPVAVGFGVSKSEHIQNLAELGADGAIVGSAIVKIIDEYKENKDLIIAKLAEYIDELYES